MKKILVLLFITCLLLTGCTAGNTSVNENTSNSNEVDVTNVDTQEVDTKENEDANIAELIDIELISYEVFNPNGFSTFYGKVSNPNNVSVNGLYDIVFYKDGSEVTRITSCDAFNVPANGEDYIWVNTGVPSKDDCDDVRLENIEISKAYYNNIKGTYKEIGRYDDYIAYEFTFDDVPYEAVIDIIYYSDKNGNKKYDAGEVTVVVRNSMFDKTGEVDVEILEGYDYTDYEIVFKAYK